jgi:hypothetical protein
MISNMVLSNHNTLMQNMVHLTSLSHLSNINLVLKPKTKQPNDINKKHVRLGKLPHLNVKRAYYLSKPLSHSHSMSNLNEMGWNRMKGRG